MYIYMHALRFPMKRGMEQSQYEDNSLKSSSFKNHLHTAIKIIFFLCRGIFFHQLLRRNISIHKKK